MTNNKKEALVQEIRMMLAGINKKADGKKRMVILVGGPASGKGFFRGDDGRKLPKSTAGLFTEDQMPESDEDLGVYESDNNLRYIQTQESSRHFKALKAAHKKGKKEFDKALEDHWYKTKDGDKTSLSQHIDYDSFGKLKDSVSMQEKANAFYISMRGWHNDVDTINPKTGKPTERFKDEARIEFEKQVKATLTTTDKQKNMVIVDSAGEDIDAQDFDGQIKAAKANGYEVTLILIDPPKDDTILANMLRGLKGDRIVDQEDTHNYYSKFEKLIEKIKDSNPDNFLHYRKPPMAPETVKKLMKMVTETEDGRPTVLAEGHRSDGVPVSEIDAAGISKAVMKELFANALELDMEASYGSTIKGVQKTRPPAPKPRYADSGVLDSEKKVDTPKKSPDKAGDQSWLEKKVRNPETGNDVMIKTLKNMPKDSKGHAYYQTLLQKKNQADRPKAAKIKIANNVFERYISKRSSDMSDTPYDNMKVEFTKSIKRQLDKLISGKYTFEGEKDSKNPVFLIIIEGGQDDVTTAREVRTLLDKELPKFLKTDAHFRNLKHRVRSFDKGKDLAMEVTFLF